MAGTTEPFLSITIFTLTREYATLGLLQSQWFQIKPAQLLGEALPSILYRTPEWPVYEAGLFMVPLPGAEVLLQDEAGEEAGEQQLQGVNPSDVNPPRLLGLQTHHINQPDRLG